MLIQVLSSHWAQSLAGAVGQDGRPRARGGMRISVFGLGYVGAVAAACLARHGHTVVGVDTNPQKVDAINAGRSPLVEPGLAPLIRDAVGAGRLSATPGAAAAVAASDLSLVCVGTPSLGDGRADLDHLQRCCRGIGAALRGAARRHLVVVRSTVPPGTTNGAVKPWLEAASGRRVGADLGLCYQPEFMREGQAIADFEHPARTVIAASDPASGERLASLYAGTGAPVIRTDFRTAELLKYVDNAWHALKVGFANEVGSLAKAQDVDSRALMAIFRRDRKLNLSEEYLAPGLAFGGSCLPKDLRALCDAARKLDLELPLLDAVLPSNRRHLERILARILHHKVERIGVVGLSFKPGTDDLRESPMVELIERLIGKGCEVRVFDPLVDPDAMVGANRAFALSHLPHIARLVLPTLQPVIDHAELLLVGHLEAAAASTILARAGTRRIVDCARGDFGLAALPGYEGICW
jgi:GDP-mannose 6-dehydrogenase